MAVLAAVVLPPGSLARAQLATVAAIVVVLVLDFAAITAATPGYGADTLALAHLAAEKTLAGQNPYQVTIDPSLLTARFGLPASAVTQLETGGHIVSLLSYPALHHLLLVPALAAGIDDLRWMILLAQLVSFVVLLRVLPAKLRTLALAPLLANPDLVLHYTAGSVTDWLWVPPMMMTAWGLHRGRLNVAGLSYGLACAIKQPPWFAAPFLVIWVWHMAGERRQALRFSLIFAGLAVIGFALPNLPYILWDAPAWLGGTLQPLLQPLVAHSYGLSLLSEQGAIPLPRVFYLLATVIVAAVAVFLYGLFFRQVRLAAWILPACLLWLQFRAFDNYLIFWLPVFGYALSLELRSGSMAALSGLSLLNDVPADRKYLALGSVVAALVVLIGAGWFLKGSEPLTLQIESAEANDLDRLTSLTVLATNQGSTPLPKPNFFVAWDSFPHQWAADGSDPLLPGQPTVYVLRPPSLEVSPQGGPLVDTQRAFPALSIRASVQGLMSSVQTWPALRLPAPSLVNGHMLFWGQVRPFDAPYGWHPSLQDGPAAKASLRHEEGQLHLEVAKFSGAAEWGEAAVVQDANLGSCDVVRLRSSRTFDYTAVDGIWPAAAAGFEIRPAGVDGRFSWFVLSEGPDRHYDLASGQQVNVVHVPKGTSTVDVPVRAALNAAGRTLPQAGILRVFVASNAAPGTYALDVNSIECLPG